MSIRGLVRAVILVASLTAASAQESILVELLSSNYDGLVNLFEHADLLVRLERLITAHSKEGVTIFAPTDYHLMHRMSPDVLRFLKQDDNLALLQKTLLNHVIVGRIDATAWSPSKTVMTLGGYESQLYLDGGELCVDGSFVRELNVLESGDGVVHAINGFLLPPDVKAAIARAALRRKEVVEPELNRRVTMVTATMASMSPAMAPSSAPTSAPTVAPGPVSEANRILTALETAGNFSILVGLIEQYGLRPKLNQLAADGHPITFFAPTNQAFAGLVNKQSEASQLTPAVIEKVLLYHVIIGEYTYAQLKAVGLNQTLTLATSLQVAVTGGTVPTAAGPRLQVYTVGAKVYLGPNRALLHSQPLLDQPGTHVTALDGVLIPPGLFLAPAPAPGAGTIYTPPSASSRVVSSVGVLMAFIFVALLF